MNPHQFIEYSENSNLKTENIIGRAIASMIPIAWSKVPAKFIELTMLHQYKKKTLIYSNENNFPITQAVPFTFNKVTECCNPTRKPNIR